MKREDLLVWRVGGGRSLTFEGPVVMGIVNVTPDSFSDGGRWADGRSGAVDTSLITDTCAAWVEAGVTLLDVGGESTRPGAHAVGIDEERARVVPALEAIRADARLAGAIRSIDTRRASVASAAIQAGAQVVNDVSGLADPAMAQLVAREGAGLVIGHMRGTPETMTEASTFTRLFDEIAGDLEASVERAVRAGVAPESIAIDPCVGFGKDARQSAALVASGRWLEDRIGRPVLIGASRKRFLGAITGLPVGSRGLASVAAALTAVECGAMLVRVHDVLFTLEGMRVRAEILRARGEVQGVLGERS